MPLEVANLLPQYCPTKMYMDGITRSIAATHAPFGIKAFNVNPAAIQVSACARICRQACVNTSIQQCSGIDLTVSRYHSVQTEMWEKIYDEMPAYGKEAIAGMGVNSKEDYAVMFNAQVRKTPR
jgi:NAD(P)-dependent dehydrogenase (short-subunit alcohol dehydrogenase family)